MRLSAVARPLAGVVTGLQLRRAQAQLVEPVEQHPVGAAIPLLSAVQPVPSFRSFAGQWTALARAGGCASQGRTCASGSVSADGDFIVAPVSFKSDKVAAEPLGH